MELEIYFANKYGYDYFPYKNINWRNVSSDYSPDVSRDDIEAISSAEEIDFPDDEIIWID